VKPKGQNMKCIYFLFRGFAPLLSSEAYEKWKKWKKWKKGFKDKVFYIIGVVDDRAINSLHPTHYVMLYPKG